MIPIRQCADICHLMSFFLRDGVLKVSLLIGSCSRNEVGKKGKKAGMIFEFLKGCILCLESLFDFTVRCIEVCISVKLLKSAHF